MPFFGSRPSSAIPRVAVLALDAYPFQQGVSQALHARGYAEGQNLAVEYLSAEADASRLARLALELSDTRPSVIVVAGTAAAKALQSATSAIPIVFVTSGDPVRSGLVPSLTQPGGNATGVTSLIPELGGKRLELLRQLVPDATGIVVMVDASERSVADSQWPELQATAGPAGARLRAVEVQGLEDVERGFDALAQGPADGLIPLLDSLATRNAKRLVELVDRRRLPTIYPSREFVELGGLMSYGASQREQFARAGVFVDKILRGAKPSELPVERPVRAELVVNRATAESLSLIMTESALLQVDEVI